MKPLVGRAMALAAALGVVWYVARQPETPQQALAPTSQDQLTAAPLPAGRGTDDFARAFRERADGRVMRGSGEVERTLADDRDGSAHQRFIIRSDSGISVLISHNIDLAPRLDGLARGDRVEVYGEYVWNEKGGLMHWTHHDPDGNHPDGYIEWRGRRYQ